MRTLRRGVWSTFYGRGGHDVLTVGEADRTGTPDSAVLTLAAATGRVLLTRNCTDYLALHERGTTHGGILCVYQDSNLGKAMRYEDIARALGNLEGSGVRLGGMFLALNAWALLTQPRHIARGIPLTLWALRACGLRGAAGIEVWLTV